MSRSGWVALKGAPSLSAKAWKDELIHKCKLEGLKIFREMARVLGRKQGGAETRFFFFFFPVGYFICLQINVINKMHFKWIFCSKALKFVCKAAMCNDTTSNRLRHRNSPLERGTDH